MNSERARIVAKDVFQRDENNVYNDFEFIDTSIKDIKPVDVPFSEFIEDFFDDMQEAFQIGKDNNKINLHCFSNRFRVVGYSNNKQKKVGISVNGVKATSKIKLNESFENLNTLKNHVLKKYSD